MSPLTGPLDIESFLSGGRRTGRSTILERVRGGIPRGSLVGLGGHVANSVIQAQEAHLGLARAFGTVTGRLADPNPQARPAPHYDWEVGRVENVEITYERDPFADAMVTAMEALGRLEQRRLTSEDFERPINLHNLIEAAVVRAAVDEGWDASTPPREYRRLGIAPDGADLGVIEAHMSRQLEGGAAHSAWAEFHGFGLRRCLVVTLLKRAPGMAVAYTAGLRLADSSRLLATHQMGFDFCDQRQGEVLSAQGCSHSRAVVLENLLERARHVVAQATRTVNRQSFLEGRRLRARRDR